MQIANRNVKTNGNKKKTLTNTIESKVQINEENMSVIE